MTLEFAACPVCTTRDFETLADEDAVKQQIEALWQFHLRRLEPGAPVQQLFDRAIFSQPAPFHIVACRQCGTVMRNPRESEREAVAVYESDAPPAPVLHALFESQSRFFAPRARTLTRLLGRSGTVLEVGSYVGAFLAAAYAQGWHAEGIDVNQRASAFAQSKNCSVRLLRIEDVEPDRRFDVVAFWNCLDQLPDPASALRSARSLLDAGGLVALRVPNGSFYAGLVKRKLTALRRLALSHNNLLGFPYRFGFTLASLGRMLANTGFEVVKTNGDTLVPMAGDWTRSWARIEEAAVKRVLRAVLPDRAAPWLEVYGRAC